MSNLDLLTVTDSGDLIRRSGSTLVGITPAELAADPDFAAAAGAVTSVNTETGDVTLDGGDIGITDSGGYYTGTDVEAALQEIGSGKLDATQPHNTQTGTSYTLVLADANKLVTLDNGSAITLTVPPNSSVAFPVGTQIDLAQLGAGAVTVAEGSGVTVNVHADDTLVMDGQFGVATLVKYATDTWLLFGKLVAA